MSSALDHRLRSPRAADRLAALMAIGAEGRFELAEAVRALLDDEAPYVFLHQGAETRIAELRLAALTTLQQLHRAAELPLSTRPIAVRSATPTDVVLGLGDLWLRRMEPAAARAARAAADDFLDERVRPDAEERAVLRAWRVLAQAGALATRLERPHPLTRELPSQRAIYAAQVADPRPCPHIRVSSREDPSRTLGFVHGDPPCLDFAESDEASRAARYVSALLDRAGDRLPDLPALVAAIGLRWPVHAVP
jgi:hypothetical protein